MLGLCRFSLLVEGGFQIIHETLQARREMLYDPRRLEYRLAWLQHVCLAGLSAQTDPDFTLVVLTGEDFPAPWMARLRAVVADLPQAVLVTRAPGRHRDVCMGALALHIDPRADVVGQFRLDDDDTVSRDYIARSRADFSGFRGLFDQHGRVASNYASGLVVSDTGPQLTFESRAVTNWSCATTLYFAPDSTTGVMDYGHHRLAEFMPTVTQTDSLMYLRGWHDGNDSRRRRQGEGEPWAEDRAAPVLLERFGIDSRQLSRSLHAARGL